MAINKTINKRTNTHGAMRNCIEYVLKEQKISGKHVYMTGPAPEVINWSTAYSSFLKEKKLWNKDSGRMYNHNIISFHKSEQITLEEALEFGREFAERWFEGFQTLIAVHQDRDHVHIHLVTNTVSYQDGRKLHNTRQELQKMKDFTNGMCEERGLTITEKGKRFDGTSLDEGEIITWSKDRHQLFTQALDGKKKSYVVDCAKAVLLTLDSGCCSKEEFIKKLKERGWQTSWVDNRKHITFQNERGEKVRDTNLSKTFSMNIDKEVLYGEFKKQSDIRRADAARAEQHAKYYAEIESANSGGDPFGEAIENAGAADSTKRPASERGKAGRSGDDTDTLIREIRTEISDSRIENARRRTENNDRRTELINSRAGINDIRTQNGIIEDTEIQSVNRNGKRPDEARARINAESTTEQIREETSRSRGKSR